MWGKREFADYNFYEEISDGNSSSGVPGTVWAFFLQDNLKTKAPPTQSLLPSQPGCLQMPKYFSCFKSHQASSTEQESRLYFQTVEKARHLMLASTRLIPAEGAQSESLLLTEHPPLILLVLRG